MLTLVLLDFILGNIKLYAHFSYLRYFRHRLEETRKPKSCSVMYLLLSCKILALAMSDPACKMVIFSGILSPPTQCFLVDKRIRCLCNIYFFTNTWIDIRIIIYLLQCKALQWRYNERDGVSNHQPLDCLLNRLFGRRPKKTAKIRVTGLWRGIHRWPVNSPHKWPLTRIVKISHVI